jgi:hypothetical protein
MPVYKSRDVELAEKAKEAGAHYSLRIVLEARAAGIPISLAFALVEKESSFRNIYGNDLVRNRAPKGKPVTKKNWQGVYLPDRKAGLGNQGAGLTQLTATEFQDRADRMGGCWIPKYQLRVGFELLAELLEEYDVGRALAAYNAGRTGWRNGMRYSEAVRALQRKWHSALT